MYFGCFISETKPPGTDKKPLFTSPWLAKCLSKCLAGCYCFIIRCFVRKYTLACKNRSVSFACLFPCSHPFTVSPSVRSEEGNLLSAKLAFAVREHRLKFTVLQFFCPHSRASECYRIVSIHLICTEFGSC